MEAIGRAGGEIKVKELTPPTPVLSPCLTSGNIAPPCSTVSHPVISAGRGRVVRSLWWGYAHWMISGLCTVALCCWYSYSPVLHLKEHTIPRLCNAVCSGVSQTLGHTMCTCKSSKSWFQYSGRARPRYGPLSKNSGELGLTRCCTGVYNRLTRVELPGPRQASQRSDITQYLLSCTRYIKSDLILYT